MSQQSKPKTQPTRPPEMDEALTKTQRQRKRTSNRFQRFYTKYRRRISFRIILIFLITLVVIGVLVVQARIDDATSQLDASWQRLERVLDTIQDGQGSNITLDDYTRIQLGVDDVLRNIGNTRSRLRLINPVVEYNEEWEVSLQLFNVAGQLTSAASDMIDGLYPLMSFLEETDGISSERAQISSGERTVDLLEIGLGSFRNASARLEQAQNLLDGTDLSEVSLDLILSHQQLQSYHQSLDALNHVLVASPDVMAQLMGLEEEVTYLVLIQNNDSIRPSGGTVDAYGWLNVRNGRITRFEFLPTTTTSPSPPSQAFVNSVTIPSWWIAYESPEFVAWNGSWYADFPSTAQLALDYYNNGNNPSAPADFVISIDLESLQQLVGVIGELTLSEIQEPITISNFRNMLYDPANFGELPQEHFIATIANQILDTLQNTPDIRSSVLLPTLLEGLTQHHIALYVPDPKVQGVINLLDWSGAQTTPENDDYIQIVDTNLTNKSDQSIVRSSNYSVEIFPDQSRVSDLRIRYDYFNTLASDNPAVNSNLYGTLDYRTLTQVFLPKEATILDQNNTSESLSVDWNNHTLFVTQLDVEYDTSQQMRVSYQTPALENRFGDIYRYRLLVEKQSGIQIQDFELQVKLPPNAEVVWLSHSPETVYSVEQPIFDFRLQIMSDRWVEILYILH